MANKPKAVGPQRFATRGIFANFFVPALATSTTAWMTKPGMITLANNCHNNVSTAASAIAVPSPLVATLALLALSYVSKKTYVKDTPYSRLAMS